MSSSDESKKQKTVENKSTFKSSSQEDFVPKIEQIRARDALAQALQNQEEWLSLPSTTKAVLGQRLNRLVEDIAGGAARGAAKIAAKTSGLPWHVGKVLWNNSDQAHVLIEAGRSLKGLRELAGLTIRELSEAMDLDDQTLLEAVESGTATLSFELILRSAALLARHDPIPFVMKFTRMYNPTIWKILDDWGASRIPLQFERERQFINIYRSRDEARDLSDEGFERLLQFTRSAFELGLQYAIEQENIQPLTGVSKNNTSKTKTDEAKNQKTTSSKPKKTKSKPPKSKTKSK